MITQSIKDIVKACNGRIIKTGSIENIENISTDSRKMKNNSLFIPLTGQNFDGHDFLKMAKDNGAIAVLYQQNIKINYETLQGIYIIEVDNTLDALQAISRYYRNLFDIPFIAVTGSTGKTSTKDMMASILSEKYNVLKNEGNFNNHIGLPLSIFNLEDNHEIGILEMGMSNFGEILELTEITRPHISVITNIGYSHIEYLGSKENIMKAKMECSKFLKADDYLLLNGDDEYLKTLKNKDSIYKKIFFGLSQDNDIYPKNLKNLGEKGFTFDVELDGREHSFTIKQQGIHNVYNALVGIWIGWYKGLNIDEINNGLINYTPSKMRMEIIKTNNITIVNDAYNASPDSMKAALSVIKDMNGNRKIAVLGNMLELGQFSEKVHRNVGEHAVDKIDILISIGDYAKWIAEEFKKYDNKKDVYTVNSNNEACDILNRILKEDDIVLLKGSRGMKLEEIAVYLQERCN